MKLYIDTFRKPSKLIDLSKDPEEQHNLINSPEHQETLKELAAIVATLPLKDSDPRYRAREANSWDKTKKAPSQAHKKDQPKAP